MDKNGLEQALIDILQKTVNGVEKGVGFLQSELPEVINQLLWWHGVKQFIYFLCGLLTIASFVYCNKKQLNYWKDKNIGGHPEIMLNVLQFIWFIPLIEFLNLDWLQILIAPKLYLIEYAAELIQ